MRESTDDQGLTESSGHADPNRPLAQIPLTVMRKDHGCQNAHSPSGLRRLEGSRVGPGEGLGAGQ